MSRLERIREMLAQEPDDEFLLYALAMELDSQGNWSESLQLYSRLIDRPTPHVASCFRAAQILAREGKPTEAIAMLENGIDQARRQGDQHTAMEMSQMLTSLQLDDQDP